MKNKKRYRAILLCLFIGALFISTVRPESIHDFSGGINRLDNMWRIQQNECYSVVDLLLDDPAGSLKPRYGYHAIASFSNPVYTIFGHKFTTDKKYLYITSDRTGSGIGLCIMRSDDRDPTSYSFSSSETNTFSTRLYPGYGEFISWLDKIYYVDGKNSTRIIDGSDDFSVDLLTPLAPGELFVLNEGDTGSLNGNYIYTMVGQIPCSTGVYSKRAGYYSREVVANNNTLSIYGFVSADSSIYASGCPIPDTTKLLILRTRGNGTNLESDSLFIIDSMLFLTGLAPLSSGEYVDNLPDDSLTASRYWGTLKNAQGGIYHYMNRYDVGYAPGQLSLINYNDSTNVDTIITPHPNTDSLPPAAALYTMTYLNNLTGIESDTAPNFLLMNLWYDSFAIWIDDATFDLPTIPTEYKNLDYSRIIYRAAAYWDSGEKPIFGDSGFVENTGDSRAKFRFDEFYPIDTLDDNGITIYIDTMGWAANESKEQTGTNTVNTPYDRDIVTKAFKGGLVHEARLFLWNDERLYASNYDTAEFDPLQNVTFDMDDGDNIIGAVSFEGYLIVYKTKSAWILYTNNGQIVDRSKRSVDYGLVSFRTLRQYRGANIYLSKDGVIFETDNRYKDNKLDREFLSDPIRELLLRSIDSMTAAVAVVYDNKYLLSFPGTDSTFVYSFLTGGWSIWTFDFAATTLFDTTDADFPLLDLYFINNDVDSLFVIDKTDTTDNGEDFTAVWEKKYIMPSLMSQTIKSLHLWGNIVAPAVDTVLAIITDQNDSLVDTLYFTNLNKKLDYRYVAPYNNGVSNWFNIKLLIKNYSNAHIDGIDIDAFESGISK